MEKEERGKVFSEILTTCDSICLEKKKGGGLGKRKREGNETIGQRIINFG